MLRFAPSPTVDMSIEDLRIAIFNYIVARQRDEQFIVRIEDTDKARNIEGKDTEILQILEKFALYHDRIFHQSENLHIHQTLAIRLLEEEKAFICTCTSKQLDADRKKAEEDGIVYFYSGRCENIKNAEVEKLKKEKIPFVIRIKKPQTPIVTHDIIEGDIETTPDEIDSFVILDTDNRPTHNFASACDDMLTGIDFIIEERENLNDTARQIHIKRLLGYDVETSYAHLPPILDTKGKEIDRHNDSYSLKRLFREGFVPDAIINYLILLGNETPEEIFTLPGAINWFSLEELSKDPISFDLDTLRFINREHLKRVNDRELSLLFGFADAEIGKLAKVYLEEASTVSELETRIKSIFAPKDFSGRWGEEMRILEEVIFNSPMIDSFDAFTEHLMKESGLKGKNFYEPLRILLTGREYGPELGSLYPHIKSYLLEVVS